MIRNSRKLLMFRKSIIRLLTEKFGYGYVDKRHERHADVDINAWLHGPSVDDAWLLSDMERINFGEAHYRVDSPCTSMSFLGIRQIHPKPKRPVPTRDEAIEQYFDWMFCGQEFKMHFDDIDTLKPAEDEQYGTVQFVDWLHPEKNSFTVYEGWNGVRNDGVAWDLIIALNHIPVAAVMITPTTPGHRPCEEAYDEMRRQLDADPCLSTYLMFCIISDGRYVLVGGPDDPPEWFVPWDLPVSQLDDAQVRFDIHDMRLVPFYGLMRRETLCDYIFGFVRPVSSDRGLFRYCAHAHLYYAVHAALDHLRDGEGLGYAVLPEEDDQRRPSPFADSTEAARQLLVENFRLDTYDDEKEADEPARFRFVLQPKFTTIEAKGTCVYRPYRLLKSPLA